MDKHVFISHAWKDGMDTAQRLYDAFKAQGISAWFDRNNLNPYNDFSGEIDSQIKQASHVVVCVTPDIDRDDSYVRLEIGYAKGHRKPIIPAMFADAVPPSSIVNNTRVNFFKETWDSGFAQLLRFLDRERNSEAPADPFQEYLDSLRQEIEEYLDTAIIREIPLHSVETAGAVQMTKTKRLLGSFSETTLSVKPEASKGPLNFDSFGDAFKQYGGRVLLLGEPGAGKTITLMTFTRAALASRQADPSKPLPILARIATWNGKQSLADWLPDLTEISRDTLARLMAEGKTLLALDGLDELGIERVDPETNEKFDPRPRFLSLLPANNQAIVSCRVQDYGEIGQKAVLKGALTLTSLTDEQIEAYLSDQPDLWVALEADAGLRDMARTPLLLSLFTYAFNGLDEEAKKLHNLSRGDLRDKIFETYVRRRYEHETRKRPLQFSLETMTDVFKQVAMENTGDSESKANLLSVSELEEYAPGLLAQGRLLHLLVVIDEECYRFIHLVLRDYFAFPRALASLDNQEYHTRAKAVRALENIGDTRAVDSLISMLLDVHPNVRMWVASALGTLGDRRAVKPLIAALNDEKSWVRWNVIQSLAKLGDLQAVDPLLAVLQEDSYEKIFAAEALGTLGDLRAVNPLIDTLVNIGDRDDLLHTVAHALGKLGDTRAVKPLISALEFPIQSGRVIEALEQIGTPEALAAVKAWRKEWLPDDDIDNDL